MFPSFYISGWVMKVKASRAVEKEMTKVRSQFALPFSQFRTWGNLNFVDWVFCLLLGSTEGREHVYCWVLEPKIIWNPWMHRRFCLVLYPFHEPMICLFASGFDVLVCCQLSRVSRLANLHWHSSAEQIHTGAGCGTWEHQYTSCFRWVCELLIK